MAGHTSYCAWTLVLLVLLCVQVSFAAKLMAIMLDGFRWDYLQPQHKGFQRLAKTGVKAEYLTPTFPSLSYPNYYSLMTGLYSESHGMVGNYMYDPERQEFFNMGANAEQFHSHWWDGGDPLWTTLRRQNKTSYMYYWPGCEVEIRGLRPTYCDPYKHPPTLQDFESAINRSLDKMQADEADFTAIYFEFVDKYGHYYGPSSPQVADVIGGLDKVIQLLLKSLHMRKMSDGSGKMAKQVNVMVFSDHGMTKVETSHIMDIAPYIYGATSMGADLLNYLPGGPLLQILLRNQSKTMEVYNKLKQTHPANVTVYLKQDMPNRWHYKNNRLIPDINLWADFGWAYKCPGKCTQYKGDHGYDNTEADMRGIFLASGPGLKRGFKSPGFLNIHLYQLMCHLLDVKASPNNGTWSTVKGMLAKDGVKGCH